MSNGINRWRMNRAGSSFTSAIELLSWDEQDAVRRAVREAMAGRDEAMSTEEFVNAMTQLGHAVATHLQGVRENQRGRKWDYDTRQYIYLTELKPVTRADFRKSMESHLISLLCLRIGSARVDMGQFPESIPRKWWC